MPLSALGVVLHEMLTGTRPFRGGNDGALLHAILTAHPEPIAARRPETPERLVRVVERLLRKDSRERYGSAAELLADLTGRRSPAVGRRVRAAALLVAVVAAVFGATAYWYIGRDADARPARAGGCRGPGRGRSARPRRESRRRRGDDRVPVLAGGGLPDRHRSQRERRPRARLTETG